MTNVGRIWAAVQQFSFFRTIEVLMSCLSKPCNGDLNYESFNIGPGMIRELLELFRLLQDRPGERLSIARCTKKGDAAHSSPLPSWGPGSYPKAE